MPIHDWTNVDAGLFHAFHQLWITSLVRALNAGLLPSGFTARAEQVVSRMQTDVLTLRRLAPPPDDASGLAVAEAPPHVRLRMRPDPQRRPRRRSRGNRSIVVRRSERREVVALIEIVSPANKDRSLNVHRLATEVVNSIEAGIHVLLLDVLPVSAYDPTGIHGAVWSFYDTRPVTPLSDAPLMFASYLGRSGEPEAFLEPAAVGQVIPPMPLFLTVERYINVPLEATYQDAFNAMSADDRQYVEEGGEVEP